MIDLTPLQLLRSLAFRHVAHDRENYRFGKVLERAQHDVNWKRGAIGTPGDEIEAGAHRPHARLGSVFGTMGYVTFPEVLWYQCLDGC